MKLIVYRKDQLESVGVKTEQGIIPLSISLKELLRLEASERFKLVNHASGNYIPENELQFEPCVPKDVKIICVGLNYKKHAEEAGMPVPSFPVLFNKFSNTLTGHGSEISLPSIATHYDYEAELGVVIGKRSKYVSRQDALQCVFGYCNVNDLSARDLQLRTGQWLLGKSLDGFCPVGPYLVTAEEVGNPNDLAIRIEVNGEVRQNSNTRDMIFPIDEIVSYVSQYMTLEPGDIILTGTPEGVIFGYPEDQRVWLQPGDSVSVEIDKLGRLTNKLKAE